MTTDGGKLTITLEWYETANFLKSLEGVLKILTVKVFVDPWGFAERGNERKTEIKKNKQVKGQVKVRENLDIISQTDSEIPRDVDKH